ncbi:hypothetical protein AGMMS49992_30790 [Clostridia bacterium]|nr:hypothetical protein AGMMS49992_30790 [Clostridia bacterium]
MRKHLTRTFLESNSLNEALSPAVNQAILDGAFNYKTITDSDAQTYAINALAKPFKPWVCSRRWVVLAKPYSSSSRLTSLTTI